MAAVKPTGFPERLDVAVTKIIKSASKVLTWAMRRMQVPLAEIGASAVAQACGI